MPRRACWSSTVPGGGFSSFSGTSMASPHASGAMALLWSAKPALKKLIRISRCYIEQSAVLPSGTPAACGGTNPADRPNNMWGWGLIDTLAAIDLGPDGDGDGIANSCDCDASIRELSHPRRWRDCFATNKKNISWDSVAPLAGTGTTYDIEGMASQLDGR
jgi:subtilisin family serine protease